MSEAQYDAIAKEYQESKLLPFRIYSELPTLFGLIGDVRGKRVLDLACGEGIYARKLKRLGAAKVVAVDLSAEMIALAKLEEEKEKLGIEYCVHDASDLGKIGEFDIVVASYLLNYATSKDHLKAFLDSIFLNLAPGGRLVGMNDNPANDQANYPLFKTYGFTKESPIQRVEGSKVTYTFYPAGGESFSFDNFYLHPDTYTQVCRGSGFSSFRWVSPIVTEAGMQEYGNYWQLFLKDPPVIGFEAVK